MSKKYFVVGIVLAVIVLGSIGGYFVFKGNTQSDLNDFSQTNSQSYMADSSAQFNDPLISYSDPSGYSFSYPKTMDVKDVTPSDNDYYSAVELSKGNNSLKIDIKTGNIDPYKNDKSSKLVGSTSLAGISTNQYQVGDRLVSVAIDQGVLYVFDGPKDSGYFEDAQGKIISSFKFAGQASAGSGSAADSNTIYEEEVVE